MAHKNIHQLRIVQLTLLLATCASIMYLVRPITATGVFELELIDLQRLDQTIDSKANLRVLICLKEAFTSQLDGPCSFGNASLTLNRRSLMSTEPTPVNYTLQQAKLNRLADSQQALIENNNSSNNLGNKNQQVRTMNSIEQIGSLSSTNLVRILFTFRWTKSFTIILTAEQISNDDQQHQSASSRRIVQIAPLQQRANGSYQQTNQSMAMDSATNNSATISGDRSPSSTSAKQAQEMAIQMQLPFTDRHVLTENEVLPNLETNPHKLWANRFSRSLKSSLAYRFRVYCSLNYFGDGCTTFCRPRDDQFGHYNCSSTGQKVCLDGWIGADCDRAKCRAGCNQQHGYCDKPDTCHCRPGWKGPRCDECITYPGCQNGYCLSPWQCECQQNWGGVLCDLDLNYCGTHEPCKNNATCQNTAPGRYKCHCLPGYEGVDCGTTLSMVLGQSSMTQLSAGCALNPCLNGGTCFGFNSDLGSTRIGAVEFGDDLSAEAPDPSRLYRCQCPAGWTGDYCQWSEPIVPSISLVTESTETNLSTVASVDSAIDIATESVSQLAESQLNADSANENLPFISIENHGTTTQHTTPHVNMRHLISGVVIASIVGVFLAFSFIAWCCLVAIKRNKFSFIQMNIIRGDGSQAVTVSATLRRVQEKLRDSFRRSSRQRIKPETKLSIENVLRPPKPPPSYEESSNYYTTKQSIETQEVPSDRAVIMIEERDLAIKNKRENLVKKGVLEQKIASTLSIQSQFDTESSKDIDVVTNAQLSCPRHGHLYRHKNQPIDYREEVTIDVLPNHQLYHMEQYHLSNHQHHHPARNT